MKQRSLAREHAAETRASLLASAAREIHVRGFQSASVSRILAETGVTKGALYHHFASKLELGYAVFDECYAPQVHANWIAPLQRAASNPVRVLIGCITNAGSQMTEDDVARGCPVNNLAQEMSPVDAGFRIRIEALLDEWRAAIAVALERGRHTGAVGDHVDPESAAVFVVASLEGCVGMAKNAQSREMLVQCGQGLIGYLKTLGRT